MPPKIKKPFVTWEEFNAAMGREWSPSAHEHIRSEVTDFWDAAFWASIPDKPSTFPPSSHTLVSHTARDHHHLVGLADDDHTQYHNDARGDTRYYTQGEIDTKLALQDTLAEMDDVAIPSPEDGELLVFDADSPPSGKWICSTVLPSHSHDDRYYTETELNNGQLDNIYFGEDEFLISSAGVADSGKPIKLNAAGLVDNTMLVACDADKVDGEHASAFSLTGHIHDTRYYTKTLLDAGQLDTRYYTESEVDTKLALQDTLAEMGDTLIVSPEDGELLVWDADSPPSGKWICSTVLPSHSHNDLYYTETELDGGQLDNRYFRENEFLVTSAGSVDSGKPIKLNAAGLVDNTMLPGAYDLAKVGSSGTPDYLSISYFEWTEAGHIMIKQNTLLSGVDADKLDGYHALELGPTHSHDDLYYTEGEVDTKLALQDTLAEMDDTIIISPEDGELLIYDDVEGKWIATTVIPSHTHDDRYYTETELNNGQLDNIYFGEDEFKVTTAGTGDSGKPIKLNAAGLVDNTMLTQREPLISAGTTAQYWRGDKTWQTLAGSHSHDDLYYTEGEMDTKLALQDTLAEMDDCNIPSPEDGEFLIFDGDFPPSGKWIAQAVGISPHAASHEVGGGDLVDVTDLTNWSSYIDQAVKIASNPQFAGVKLDASTYYLGSGALPSKLYQLYIDEIYADVGGVTDPSYTFNGDTNTGMYSPTADQIAFACGSVLSLHIAATYTRLGDNVTLRLGVGNDFRMWHDGTNTYFRNYKHGALTYFQGEDAGGTNKSLMCFDPDIPGVEAYDHGPAATDQIVNVCYGTGDPPTATNTTIGTLFIKYSA